MRNLPERNTEVGPTQAIAQVLRQVGRIYRNPDVDLGLFEMSGGNPHPFSQIPVLPDDDSDHWDEIELSLIVARIDPEAAEQCHGDFLAALEEYPDQIGLHQGLSIAHAIDALNGDLVAFGMFALGQHLGLWQVSTPEQWGVYGLAAIQLTRSGWLTMSGLVDGGSSCYEDIPTEDWQKRFPILRLEQGYA